MDGVGRTEVVYGGWDDPFFALLEGKYYGSASIPL
jgi:hypothetical protein